MGASIPRPHQELPTPSSGGSPSLLRGELSEAIPALSSGSPGGDPELMEAGAGFIQRQVSGAQGSVRNQALCGGFSVKLGPRSLFSPGALRAGPQSTLSFVVRSPSAYTSHPRDRDLQALVLHSLCAGHPRPALPNPPGGYQERRLVFSPTPCSPKSAGRIPGEEADFFTHALLSQICPENTRRGNLFFSHVSFEVHKNSTCSGLCSTEYRT